MSSSFKLILDVIFSRCKEDKKTLKTVTITATLKRTLLFGLWCLTSMFLVSSPPAIERTVPPFLKAVYRTTEPPGVMTMDQDCPGKSNPLQTLFLISIAWSVEEGDTIMSKVAKSKEKPATKMEKPQNEPSSKTTKIKFEAILNVFFSRLVR